MLFKSTKKIKEAPQILIWQDQEQWLQGGPITNDMLQQRVVVLDFWTYSCINCIRTLPILNTLLQMYEKFPFIIIGVHTPEFKFEQSIENVKKGITKLGVAWPVVNDPERVNWERFGNVYWPRTVVISGVGGVLLNHTGEGGYDEIERAVAGGLRSLGAVIPNTLVSPIAGKSKMYHGGVSQETYAGSHRGQQIGSKIAGTEGECRSYIDPGNYEQEALYLQGLWKQEEEFLEFRGKSGWISFRYYAEEVNVVLEGDGKAEVKIDNMPLSTLNAGKDIIFEGKRSFIQLHGGDMYNIIQSGSFHTGVLTIYPFPGLRVYAYTFG